MTKKWLLPASAWLLFAGIAAAMTLITGTKFFLFNFLYIGTFLAWGLYLSQSGYPYARRIVQFGVGLYMLVFLGIIAGENMQLSGFFYFLFLGVFQAAVIHYTVAKIAGPLIFGRAWCSYACWTAMILELLPFPKPETHERKPKLGLLRYVVFAVTLVYVACLFLFRVNHLEQIMYVTFLVGNVFYYGVGIFFAYRFRDNRAFCKYFCPIATFLKPMSYFSLVRINRAEEGCTGCKKCLSVCPMDVDMMDNRRKRKNATECILCGECVRICPKRVLKL